MYVYICGCMLGVVNNGNKIFCGNSGNYKVNSSDFLVLDA